jgi:hypothetical protein
VTLEDVIENIDIGETATLRARFRLAKKVFQFIRKHEGAITKDLAGIEL